MTAPGSLLDAALGEWHFRERHSTHVEASPADCYRALRELTAPEVRTLAPLMALARAAGEGHSARAA